MNYVVTVQTGAIRQLEKIFLVPNVPVIVGRAYESDVVVDDDYMDAQHIEFTLDEAGNVLVRDIDTENGTVLGKKRLTSTSPYSLHSEIQSGESVITLQKLDAQVAPALKRETVHTLERNFGSILWTLLATAFASAGVYLSATLVETAEVNKQLIVDNFIMVGLGVLSWCLVAGMIGKLFRHKSYLKLHWILSCAVFGISSVVTLLFNALQFNLDSSFWFLTLDYAAIGLSIWLLIYGTLSLSTRIKVPKKAIASTLLAVFPAIVGAGLPMLAEDHENWSDLAYVARVNQPPSLLFRQPTTLTAHIESSEGLFAQLDHQIESSRGDEIDPPQSTPETTVEIVVSDADQ